MRWICLLLCIWGVRSIKTNTTTAENDPNENASIKSYFESSTYVLLAPAPPVITSSSRTSDPNSYLLSWKRDKLEGFLSYKIRYIKADHLSNFTLTRGEISKLWSYASVVSNVTFYLLNNLHPSSLYQVEMVGVTRNATSQLAVSSFRTGLEKPQFQIPIFNSNTTSAKHKKNQKKTQKFGFGGLPPESPSTPTVTELSATSVSLMWYPRFNGGSPITEYQVQSRIVG
uniref:Fibronectin type-III domain-containing protein n=1 Tax=Ciona savignyi TaxID=51511 RepID=H2Z3U7_CIOSA